VLTKIFLEFEGKIGGCGIRVPVPDGFNWHYLNVKKAVSIKQINEALNTLQKNSFIRMLDYTEDPIVSVDARKFMYIWCNLLVIDKMVKVVGWSDNENGYSSRPIDLIPLTK
jgi:glyceraldehyde 3-phosphate dehydrogenase